MKKLILTSILAIAVATSANAAPTDPATEGYVDTEIDQVYDDLRVNMDSIWDEIDSGAERVTEIETMAESNTDRIRDLQLQTLLTAQDVRHTQEDVLALDGRVGALDANVGALSGRMDTFQTSLDGLKVSIDERFDEVDEKIASSAATSAALSGLDNHLDAGKKFGFGFGGGYNKGGAGAISFGAVVRATSTSAVNLGGAVSDNGDYSIKGGMNWQF